MKESTHLSLFVTENDVYNTHTESQFNTTLN